MAEWFKAAVLKTVVRKYRGFESYSLRHFLTTERSAVLTISSCIYQSKKIDVLLIWRGGRVGLRRTPAKCV